MNRAWNRGAAVLEFAAECGLLVLALAFACLLAPVLAAVMSR